MKKANKIQAKEKKENAIYATFGLITTKPNIIKKISIPDDLQSDIYIEYRISSYKPWTALSHEIYGNQDLWWLICLTNKIYNPINNPELGAVYKIIKPDFVNVILQELKNLTA